MCVYGWEAAKSGGERSERDSAGSLRERERERETMQDICKQIRESTHRRNPNPSHLVYAPQPQKPNPKFVQHLDLSALVAPENLKASGNNITKSCAKRVCRCEYAIGRKPPPKPRHVEKEKKKQRVHTFMPLPDLQERQEEGDMANDENDENHASSHRWNSDSLSFARYCEAKLEDLLKPDGNCCNESPDARRTDACFQVLEELCQNKLPFSSVLRHICDELRRATYSNSQDSSSTLGTQERAYFELAHKLEGEISQMEAGNSSWQASLSAQSHDLMTTRGELEELGDELTKADSASNELEEKLSLTVQALSYEKEKVNGLHEKIKKLKKELKEIRHEVKRAQQTEILKDKELEEYEKLKAVYMQLVHEFQHSQAFLHSSQCEVAESASKKDLIAAKAEILELEDKITQVRAQIDAFASETRSLTPRPQWGRQVPGMDKPPGLSTAQQIEKICRENAFLVASASRLQIDFAATEMTLAEMQGHGKGKTKSKNANPKKAKGRNKPKEKAEK